MTARREARSAAAGDLDEVMRLLERAGIHVARESLERRVTDEHSGIVLAGEACASWVVDGGALHVYDVVGDTGSLVPVIEHLNGVARERFAAVMVVTAYEGDPTADTLTMLGFERDWDEADVRGGRPVRLLGLIREVR